MNIDRRVYQGGLSEAVHRVSFVLDQLEKYGVYDKFDWKTKIGERLTLEEMIGALVSAEQACLEVNIEDNPTPMVGSFSFHGMRVT